MKQRIIKLARLAIRQDASKAYHDSQWYEYAGQFCADTARDFGLSQDTVAGIVAALSPLQGWDTQLHFTPLAIAGGLERGTYGIVGPGFFSNKDKAARILQGEAPLDVLGGDKVRSFYRNLIGEKDSVTVDRHAIKIAGFSSLSADAGKLTSNVYGLVSEAYRDAAKALKIAPCEVQALTWNAWKELP